MKKEQEDQQKTIQETEQKMQQELKQEKQQKECRCAEYLDIAKRVQAEFDNYRKRNNNSVQEAIQYGQAQAATTFLPVLESIDEALKISKDVEGMTLIKKQIDAALKANGIAEIDAFGKNFDPNSMHAIMAEEMKDVPQNVVTQVMQKGYTINGKVLRPAMVKVSK